MSNLNKNSLFSNEVYNKYNLLFKFLNLLKFILTLPIIILHLVFYPFLKVRIGHIYTKTIGNYVSAFEIFNYENKSRGGIIFWFTDSIVANKFWLKKIKEKKYYFIPGFLGSTIYAFYSKFKLFHIFIVPERNFKSSGDLSLIKKKKQT